MKRSMHELRHNAGGKFHPLSEPDYLPREQLQALQLDRLRTVAEHAYEHVELFRKRMDQEALRPDGIRCLEDIRKLPLCVKNDLRDTYPFGLFASPMNEVVRLHASSGTTGKPIVVGYTQQDMDVWTSVMVRTLASCGLGRSDVIQNAYGYGLFTGGLGAHYGAEALGATVIPISGGNTDRQLMVMRDFNVTAICCTPSYFLRLMEYAEEMGTGMKSLPIAVGVFGAEPWTEAMRQHIEAEAGIAAFDIYGLSEIIGPGVASECSHQQGLHLFEDHFYPEILDPETLEPVPDGEEGELILTTLSKLAMPMIRYRTRDITAIIPGQCACGRTIRRIKRISRRSDDMLIIRGVNVFPSQIEAAMLTVEGTLPHYQIVLTNDGSLDQMEVQVEVIPGVLGDNGGAMEALQDRLTRSVEQTTGLRVHLQLVRPGTLARSEGKAQRVFDRRAAAD